MIRFLILIGYTLLMAYLQVTKQLDQYINVHYRYLVILSMLISLVLALVQLIIWNREDPAREDEGQEKVVTHTHSTGLTATASHPTKRWLNVISYLLLALPLLVGFCFPTVSLDTSIIDAKGFSFPLSQESVGDPEMETQYLKPDTSIYFEADDYQKQMNTILKNYQTVDHIQVTDENYLEVMELIYTYPSEFISKTITYQGFIFHSPTTQASDIFVFRFGIIHCVADSGVFGLLTHFSEAEKLENNQWVQVTGVITDEFYAPFKRDLPTVTVTDFQSIAAPTNQYVYRSF